MSEHNPDYYKGTAWYYARYRKHHYPQAAFDLIIETLGLDGTGRLLDLGAGTGEVAVPMAKYFEKVDAVESQAEMIDEGKQRAKKANVSNIAWHEMTAEEFAYKPETYRFVTAGSALHWMDGEKVLSDVYKALVPGGGVAIITGRSVMTGEEKWQKVTVEVIKKYLGEKRRAGKSAFKKPKRWHDEVMKETGFKDIEIHEIPMPTAWTIEEIIGNLYSTSFASKRLFGDNAGAFENDLKDALLKLNPKGTFTDERTVQVIIGRK